MPSVADELQKLAQLRDQGVLSQDEFDVEKAKVLANAANQTPLQTPQSSANLNPFPDPTRVPNQPLPGQISPNQIPMPPTYMTQAILATLLCCLPFGIVAIIKASNVSNAYSHQKYHEAQKFSDDAKMWINVSVVTGLIVGVLFFIASVAGASVVS